MKNTLLKNEIDEILENEWIIFTSVKSEMPRSIVVIPSRVEYDKMIISNIQMSKTYANIIQNKNCFINVYIKNKKDKQYKIECSCETFEQGNLFDEIKLYEETNNLPEDLKVKSIIVANFLNIEVSEG